MMGERRASVRIEAAGLRGAARASDAPPRPADEPDLDAVYIGRDDGLDLFEGAGSAHIGVRIAGAPAPRRGQTLRAYLAQLAKPR
ncbi:MAG: hypothetical protein H6744_09445 [Deltaproteobacteria bacterium]|nr:hypothetical protein [Deltaproteobacteria bacterium]